MDNKRRNILLIAIVTLTALPATSAYLLYKITNDPTLRPLGITQEELAKEAGSIDSVAIEVSLDWGMDRTDGTTQEEMRAFISDLMLRHTEDFVLNVNEVPGTQIGVSFGVGHNSYGPFEPGQLAEGLRTALLAFYVTKQSKS